MFNGVSSAVNTTLLAYAQLSALIIHALKVRNDKNRNLAASVVARSKLVFEAIE